MFKKKCPNCGANNPKERMTCIECSSSLGLEQVKGQVSQVSTEAEVPNKTVIEKELGEPKWGIGMSEEVLGTIVTGRYGAVRERDEDRRFLFFTSHRIIVASGTVDLADSLVGLFDWLAGEGQLDRKAEQLKTFSADEILTADKKNFEIPYSKVTEVKLEKDIKKLDPYVFKLSGQSHLADDPSNLEVVSLEKICITTVRKKYKFTPIFKEKEFCDPYEKLIRSVLADKVSIQEFHKSPWDLH